MTVRALGNLIRKKLSELAGVNIFVTLLALLWSFFEVHIGHLGFEVRRLMAVNTGYRPVRTD